MAAFRSGEAGIGLAHAKSMGHGIDGLQNVCNILVRFGHDWNLGERMQMLERIGPMRQLQAGLDRPVWVYDIMAENTLDEDVIESHTAKRNVQDALLLAMKRRG
jgi:SNF2 family DNA or RNA helicase